MSSGDQSSGKHTEAVQQALREHSEANIDEYVQASTFGDEKLHDVGKSRIQPRHDVLIETRLFEATLPWSGRHGSSTER